MKYDSLKRQSVKSFKISALDGGINASQIPENINDNQVPMCKNMWYKDGRLQTRPGFNGDSAKAINTRIYGYSGELEYKVTDTEIYLDGIYYRIAVSDVITDDYAHYTYVYLIDLEDNIKPIGNMTFFRISSEIFNLPTNIIFFNGKSQNGGGIFAFVTLTNKYNVNEKSYIIFEVNADFTEWERVYDYYIPTIFINGRGNKYQVAKKENGLSYPAPKELESQNMLNGRFHAYYTSDGYSNSFKLPFTNLAEEKVVCRFYYTLVDYLEWEFPSTDTLCKKKFMNKDVSGILDREKGVVYFITEDGDFPLPIIDMYHENNIKITATKEIENGFQRIVYSTCGVRNNSKLLIAGGMDGNTVYTADYDNPLYFPIGSSVKVGESDNGLTALSVQNGKIIAFKRHSLYTLSMKNGSRINEISLLSDNDRVFYKNDSFTVAEVSQSIGCSNKKTVVSYEDVSFWLGSDNKIYAVSGGKDIINISDKAQAVMPDFFDSDTFAVGGEDYYILVKGKEIFVFDCKELKNAKAYKWESPECASVESGYYHNGRFKFLCTGEESNIAFIANLEGDTDSFLHNGIDNSITQLQVPIKNSVITKFYALSSLRELKNVDSIYLLVAAKGKVKISVNGMQLANINFGFSNEIYDKCDYKTVKLSPHLYATDSVYLTLCSDRQMSIGEIEIIYRITG